MVLLVRVELIVVFLLVSFLVSFSGKRQSKESCSEKSILWFLAKSNPIRYS